MKGKDECLHEWVGDHRRRALVCVMCGIDYTVERARRVLALKRTRVV